MLRARSTEPSTDSIPPPADVTLSIYLEDDDVEAARAAGAAGSRQKTIIRTTWGASDDTTSCMETEFTPCGKLREARSCVLIPADNEVPSMDGAPATVVQVAQQPAAQ